MSFWRDPSTIRLVRAAVQVPRWARRRLGMVSLVLLTAGGVHVFVWGRFYAEIRNEPNNRVGFWACMFARRDTIRILQTEAALQTAHERVEQNQLVEAAHWSLHALALKPENLAARRLVGEIYFRSAITPLAFDVWEGALNWGYPGKTFLVEVIAYARQADDYAAIVSLCDRALALEPDAVPAEDRAWLTAQNALALVGEGKFEHALEITEGPLGNMHPLSCEARLLALLELERFGDAESLMEAWRLRAGPIEPVLRLTVRLRRDVRDLEGLKRAVNEFRALNPTAPDPYVYEIIQRQLADDGEGARAALDSYLLRFGSKAQNLVLAVGALTQIGASELVVRCVDAARESGLEGLALQREQVHLAFKTGNWAEAERLLSVLRRRQSPPMAYDRLWLNWADRLRRAVASDHPEAQQRLIEHFRQARMPIQLSALTYEALVRAGRIQTAREVIGLAVRHFPGSQKLRELARESGEQGGAAFMSH